MIDYKHILIAWSTLLEDTPSVVTEQHVLLDGKQEDMYIVSYDLTDLSLIPTYNSIDLPIVKGHIGHLDYDMSTEASCLEIYEESIQKLATFIKGHKELFADEIKKHFSDEVLPDLPCLMYTDMRWVMIAYDLWSHSEMHYSDGSDKEE